MKKRNTAIRRIVKAIESEHTVEGELLLWETTAKAVQKDSGIDPETIQYVFKLLKRLKLIQHRDWSVSSRTYIVGLKYPTSERRSWIPAVIALPHLKELSISPRFLYTKLCQENILLQMNVDLFKAGMFVYLGDDLKGPPYSSMLEKLKACLKDMTFRQNTIIRLISRNSSKTVGNLALIKVFFDIYVAICSQIFSSFEYFIENKGLNTAKKGQISTLGISTNIISTIGKNTVIRNTILRNLVSSNALTNGNSSDNRNNIHFSNQSEKPSVDLPQQKPVSNRKELKPSDPAKQKILDAYWNARKCVYGVMRTQRTSTGFLRYSADLPAYFRKAVNTAKKAVEDRQYPISPRKLFMALFLQYSYLHKNVPAPRTWCVSDQFAEWSQDFAGAYDELRQFQETATPVKVDQFEHMKEFFFKSFEKKFGVSVLKYFGMHLGFYIDWCILRAVRDFIVAKTYFEHRTRIEATMSSYVFAQLNYLSYQSNVRCIRIDWIFGVQARSRMEVWIKDHDPDAYISRERREQLAKFFAEQESRKTQEAAVD